ncbi:hypothetical protein, conserved [Leishmania tarentolae]|uniref:Uncharacterized protein n=1 Tax=Leishmania tarentolae TaxID=5689 RepID=A0A640KD24_LEITA|nr:hypothetical protein, conserved [Leishmania tarentolae]
MASPIFVPPPPPAVIPLPSSATVVPPPASSVVPPPPPTATVPPPPAPSPPSSSISLQQPPGIHAAVSAASPPLSTIAAAPPSLAAAPLAPTSVAASPPPAQAATGVPAPPPVQPISVEAWKTLQSATRDPVPNMESTRYLAVDERVRDEVCRLFILSGYDVGTLMINIAQSLQHVGRHDVGLLRNENNTAFTITQSAAHARQGGAPVEQRRQVVADAVERINQAGSEAERAFAEVAQGIKAAAPPVAPMKDTSTVAVPAFRKSAYELLMEQIAATRRGRSPQNRRIASLGRRPKRAAGGAGCVEYPTSYNGSYLLQRYGGTYDPQRQYSHYRYHDFPPSK